MPCDESPHGSIRAACNDRQATCSKRFGECLSILDNLSGVGSKGGPQRLPQSHCLGADHMHERATLQPGENGRIDCLAKLKIVAEDETAAWATQRLVRG